MIELISGALYLTCGIYVSILGAFAWGLQRILWQKKMLNFTDDNLPTVTVMMPARNESDNIEQSIRAVMANDYPAERFELFVIDDVSEDDTAAKVQQLMTEFPNLTLLSIPENEHRTQAHKKRALEKGVLHSHSEIVLTTDADCQVPPTWICTMVQVFEKDTAFVAGSVLFPKSFDLPTIIQALEFTGLVAVGAGAIGIGNPTICNGANVAYRRKVFLDLKGFDGIDHLTSGDDDLLMQKIAASKTWKVKYCASLDATVQTYPVQTLSELLNQRKRWASKGAVYPNKFNVALIFGIYFFFVALLGIGALLPFKPELLVPFVICMGAKILVEVAILIPATWHFKRFSWMLFYLPQQILHAPYIVYIGAASFWGDYQWKGRRIHR